MKRVTVDYGFDITSRPTFYLDGKVISHGKLVDLANKLFDEVDELKMEIKVIGENEQ